MILDFAIFSWRESGGACLCVLVAQEFPQAFLFRLFCLCCLRFGSSANSLAQALESRRHFSRQFDSFDFTILVSFGWGRVVHLFVKFDQQILYIKNHQHFERFLVFFANILTDIWGRFPLAMRKKTLKNLARFARRFQNLDASF